MEKHCARSLHVGKMVMMNNRVFAVTCLLWALADPLRANFGGYEAGNASTGNVQPLAMVEDVFRPAGLGEVEMQDELLQITLHIESADVEVNYTLHNPGDKTVKVTAGFPTASQDVSAASLLPENAAGVHHDPRDVTDYHLFVDGKEVPAKLEAQPRPAKIEVSEMNPDTYSTPQPYWFVSTVPFKAGESHAVRVRYRAEYRRAEGGVSDDDAVAPTTLSYQFSTAAGWKGPIGKGRVVIQADTVDADAVKIRPEGRFQRTGRAFVWEFTNLKPTLADDLTVQVREGYNTFPATYAVTKDRPDGDKEQYLGEYEVHPSGASYWINQLFHATATSTLDPKQYGPENVAEIDSDHTKTWAEGVPGDGIGEGLDLTLDKPEKLYQIGLVNGYAKNEALYQANGRVAELSVSLNGEKDFAVQVPDEFLKQSIFWFPLNGYDKPVRTVRLRINKVYRGTKYQDTCLTRVYLKTKLAKKPKLGPIR